MDVFDALEKGKVYKDANLPLQSYYVCKTYLQEFLWYLYWLINASIAGPLISLGTSRSELEWLRGTFGAAGS